MSEALLLEKLDPLGRARAQSLPLFADAGRLARKPRCSHTKDYSVIRSAPHALTHAYIQPNSPMAYSRLVFDLDWHDEKHPHHSFPIRYLAECNAWEKDLSVPAPDWIALSREKNSGHIGYEIPIPIGRHEHARVKPQQYLAAIETALGKMLGADEGYAGVLCKNPINSTWDLYQGHSAGRDLGELADWLDLTADKAKKLNREPPRGEVGRNVYLFDVIRYWAYDNIDKYRNVGYERWYEALLVQAETVNATAYGHLTTLKDQRALRFSDCRAIARSVAKWVWTNYGQKTLTDAFRELQSWRGKRGAAVSAAVKRQAREAQIVDAIGQLTAQGIQPTMHKVAALLGCSQQALSKTYKHMFTAI